jgi:hypothetical protein
MKIRIRSDAHQMVIPIPAGPGILQLVLRLGKVPATRKSIRRMWNSLTDAKSRCGSWELVRVETASGSHIIVEI